MMTWRCWLLHVAPVVSLPESLLLYSIYEWEPMKMHLLKVQCWDQHLDSSPVHHRVRYRDNNQSFTPTFTPMIQCEQCQLNPSSLWSTHHLRALNSWSSHCKARVLTTSHCVAPMLNIFFSSTSREIRKGLTASRSFPKVKLKVSGKASLKMS